MSEAERRRKYRYDRVLIETARVLSPQFDDAVLYLSGAQIEMLRNMTQYLRRLETYVTTYAEGYYLAPTVAEYDDLLEIVADLEETLMGNENTIWGYEDRISMHDGFTKGGVGDATVVLFTVPAGYVYEINVAMSRNAGKTVDHTHIVYDGTTDYEIAYFTGQVLNTWAIYDRLQMRLKAGDRYKVLFSDCSDGNVLRVRVWGYRMKVPV